MRSGLFPLISVLAWSLAASAVAGDFSYKPELGTGWLGEGTHDGEMIELSTGLRHNIGPNETEILIGARFGGIGQGEFSDEGDYMYLYVARIDTEVGIGLDAGEVTRFRVDIRPLGVSIGSRNFEAGALDVLPLEITADHYLDEEVGVGLMPLEIRAGHAVRYLDGNAALLINSALKGLGYKMANYIEGKAPTFHGAELIDAHAEIAGRSVSTCISSPNCTRKPASAIGSTMPTRTLSRWGRFSPAPGYSSEVQGAIASSRR